MSTVLLPKIRSLLKEIDLRSISDEQLVNCLLERSISVLAFLDSLLCQFIYANFLGGHIDDLVELEAETNAYAAAALVCEGEHPFKQTKYLTLLWLCKRIAQHMCSVSRTMLFPYMLFWLKCVYLHQYVIGQERSSQLSSDLVTLLELNESEVTSENRVHKLDLTCFFVLASYLSAFYYRYEIAHDLAVRCAEHLRVTINFSGALGKRTRFQETDKAHLWINIDRPQEPDLENIHSAVLPKAVTLTDDVLLNNVVFTSDNPNRFSVLSLEEQGLVLLMCELHRLTQPKDDLTTEQRLAYINFVLNQGYPDSQVSTSPHAAYSVWPIATEALFCRSLIEQTSSRKLERSLSQLEELSNQFSRGEPPCYERCVEYFFLSRMPSVWMLELEQAHLLQNIGCYKSALDIFLRWDRWFDIITCYTHLNKRQKAEEMILAQINRGDHSPQLYCALGDVTNNREHYETAWQLSQCKSARAMRSLAIVYMYADKDYTKAIDCFEKSLAINSLQISLWFTFGCCCLQAKQFDKAESAFRRCVLLDADNFEAWNNCATAAVMQGKKDVALRLLKEACKHNFEDWRIWENISYISADVGSFNDTIQACHRLLDLRNKFTDSQVLGVLTKAVVDNVPDQSGLPASRFRPRILELFARVTACTPNVAEIWTHYANLLLCEKPVLQQVTFQRAVQHLQMAHRCRVHSNEGCWEQSDKKRSLVVQGLITLTTTVLNAPTMLGSQSVELNSDSTLDGASHCAFVKSALASIRLGILSVAARLKRVEQATIDRETCAAIGRLRESVEELLPSVLAVL